MVDELNDDWWENDADDSDGEKVEKKAVEDESSEITGHKRKPDMTGAEISLSKPSKKRRRKRITDMKLDPKGMSIEDFKSRVTGHYKGKLSAVEMDSIILDDTHFGPVNVDMSYTMPSILREALPKWQRLISQHKSKKSPLVLLISSGAVRALKLNKEALLFKGEKCKTAKLFAKHMKLEAQAKYLESNTIHFAVGTPSRVSALLAQGSLSLDHTMLILLDWNWRDVKLKRMIDIPDINKALISLLKEYVIPACKFKQAKIALF